MSWCPLRCPNKNDVRFVFTSNYLCSISVICFCFRIVVSNTYCVVLLFSFYSFCVRYIASLTGLSIFCSLFGNLFRLFMTKRDDFNLTIINVSHLYSNMPTSLAYEANIVQLIRLARIQTFYNVTVFWVLNYLVLSWVSNMYCLWHISRTIVQLRHVLTIYRR